MYVAIAKSLSLATIMQRHWFDVVERKVDCETTSDRC